MASGSETIDMTDSEKETDVSNADIMKEILKT